MMKVSKLITVVSAASGVRVGRCFLGAGGNKAAAIRDAFGCSIAEYSRRPRNRTVAIDEMTVDEAIATFPDFESDLRSL